MIKNTFNHSFKFSLFNKQLKSLNLLCKTQQSRTNTRKNPRTKQPFDLKTYRLVYWHHSRTYPPNFKDDHHIFYPSLNEYFENEKKENDNTIKINLGFPLKEIKEIIGKKKIDFNKIELKTEEDLFNFYNFEESENIDFYDKYNQAWCISNEGVNEIVNLAFYYKIFRDLFSIRNEKKKISSNKVDFGDFYPRPDYVWKDIYEKHYPGAIKVKSKEKQELYYFNPIVPIHVDFNASDNSNEVSCVYRGNIIEPSFSFKKPNILIDTSYFKNKKLKNLYFDLVEDEKIKLIGGDSYFYTVCLLNLDNNYLEGKPICHYLVSDINLENNEVIYDYLPVYGIKGLGFHRYVFLVFRHEKKLSLKKEDNFNNLKSRIFDPMQFLKIHKNKNITPVGLNWFQTKWDESCKHIFHNILNSRMPVYEYMQEEEIKNKQIKFPAPASFNNYLDRYRDKKEIIKEVLLERLKNLDPFDYKNQFKERELPPNIYKVPRDIPSWLKNDLWKKRNLFGKYRYLRPSSALLEHNNNADLDNMFWPHPDKLQLPMRYPFESRQPKLLKDTKWSIPPEEHPTIVSYEENDSRKFNEIESTKFIKELEKTNKN